MEVKFFAGDRVMDLSRQKLSIQESNSKVSDKIFTKYLFPFEFYMNEEFLNSFGDFQSEESYNLESVISGMLFIEGRLQQAKLTVEEITGNLLTGQIDFGFEELPNWNKKLSELPLENFKVPDIYDYAASVLNKKYPETNFNFPRIYTKKYDPENKVWDAFDGYYNHLKLDGSGFRRNYIDEKGDIYNANIMHPCPHLIYLLKRGFQDAGFRLQGEVLADPMFRDCWVYSGTEYFTSKQQRRYNWKFGKQNYEGLFLVNGPDDYAEYKKLMTIEKPGLYKIAGRLVFFKGRKMYSNYYLKLNGRVIWSKVVGSDKQTLAEEIAMNLDFNVTDPNSVLELYIYMQYSMDAMDEVANLTVTSDALQDIQNSSLGEDTGVVTNLNEINLGRAVPEMTFGDLVNLMRNWFNYDFDIAEGIIIMNKIGDKEPQNIQDCEHWAVQKPKRKLLQKRSFLLQMPQMEDGYKIDSMYFDKDGAFLNREAREETTIISINGYALPVELARPAPVGQLTATAKKDSPDSLNLVWYSGLKSGQNNADVPPGVNFPELFYTNWEKWLRQRVNGQQFNWKFMIDPERLGVQIKNYIKVYNRIHIITSWTKDLNNKTYEVDITTESI